MNGEKYILQMVVDVKNDKALGQLQRDMQKMTGVATKSNKAMTGMSKTSKRMNYQIQNASYQFADMAVQVQGGVSALRAFSQQAPQLLGGFGPVGAVIGVFAAILPTVVMLFRDTSKEIKEFDDVATSLSETLGRLESDFGDGLGPALDKFSESFNRANLAMRSNMLDSIRADLIQAKHDITSMAKSIGADMQAAVEVGGFKAFTLGGQGSPGVNEAAVANLELKRTAELLKTTTEGASAFLNLMGKINTGSILPEETPELLNDLIIKYKLTGDQIRELRKQVSAFVSEAKREEDLLAYLGGGTGDREVKAKTGKTDAQKAFDAETKAMQATIAAYANYSLALYSAGDALRANLDPQFAFEQSTTRMLELLNHGAISWDLYKQAVEKAEETLRKATEEKSFTVQIFESFDKAFQSFVNGIAAGTTKISDLFKNMAQAVIAELLRIAAYKAVMSLFGGTDIGAAFGKATGATAFAKGGVVQPLQKFANGGVTSGPTPFAMRGGFGLAGERGAEAILPLGRGADGKLGVTGSAINVTVNNNAAGVAVNTRPDGNGGLTVDVIKDLVAGEINAGGNAIADAIQDSFGLGRGHGVSY